MRSAFLGALMLSASLSMAQSYEWTALSGAPVAGRHDDMSWITPDSGWVINSAGQILKTTDGGQSWTLQHTFSGYLRSVKFTDSKNGWVGTLSSATPLLRTSDGGTTWNPVSLTSLPKPKRICGLSAPTSSVIYGSGAYDGPAVIIKSTDGGASWTSIDMSAYAQTLIDIHFFTADTGIVIGGGKSGSFAETINSVILYTTNGGTTWTSKYTGSLQGEWGWKIYFVNRLLGFVSLEDFDAAAIMKTTDGGLTWSRHLVADNFNLEGIGFINENLGWVGGHGLSSQTTNGGANWSLLNIAGGADDEGINRFRFFGDSLGYASGKTIYKYAKKKFNSVDPVTGKFPSQFQLGNYPNPFNPSTVITYTLPTDSHIKLRIYNGFGQEIITLSEGFQPRGEKKITWNGKDENGKVMSSGVYFYRLDAGKFSESSKMILMK